MKRYIMLLAIVSGTSLMATQLDQGLPEVESLFNCSSLIEQLFAIGAVKIEPTQLHDGTNSPVFIDMQSIISHPHVFHQAVQALWEKARYLTYDLICGIPTNAIPFAVGLALYYHKPMIMHDVERHSLNPTIIGSYAVGNEVLLVEDVLASGECCIDTINLLREAGLDVKYVITLIDREMGAKERLEAKGVRVFSVFTLSDLIESVPCK